ncbi:hypothetical protein K1719_047604 [Acacia pycnantha]|nr:hypothetical protein K1719_047604 [Acacia pycnantha]
MGGEELRKHEGSFMEEEDDEEVELPGFRFHPTDEELVGFYLRRQLDKKPIKIELIKQIDIYKYDPWDLPKASCTGGEKEWYFFCKRGRKYRNSIRPNRVTGSGFWKATGIDKPIAGQDGECIGLKKTLVYYRGSAGKGTKTDWMMHEFRLPSLQDSAGPTNATTAAADNATIAQQAVRLMITIPLSHLFCLLLQNCLSYSVWFEEGVGDLKTLYSSQTKHKCLFGLTYFK